MHERATFDFVVSTENVHYLAWQAMLFHYSCLEAMGQPPIIVVHSDDDELLPQYQRIQECGGRVQQARNFRREGGWEYPPRNTPGSIHVVQSDADYLVICDADMIFLRPLPLDDYLLADNQITFDKVGYLVVTDENREELIEPARAAGVDLSKFTDHRFSGGVPHIIPRTLQEALSRDWLECIRTFEPQDASLITKPGMHLPWLSSMWGLLFTVSRLELEVVLTDWCIGNCPGTNRLDAPEYSNACLVHYCFGDMEFDKRNYMDESGALSRVWNCTGSPQTINGAIVRQMRATARYFGMNARDN